jgi:hypothetical protein
MSKKRTIGIVLMIMLTVTTLSIIFGKSVSIILIGALVAGFIAWQRTTFHRPAGREIVTLYFVTIAAHNLHVMEEYVFQFATKTGLLFGEHHMSDITFLIVIGGFLVSLEILMGVGLMHQNPVANYFAWFIFMGPGFMEFTHFVFPLLDGMPYQYFPGMWSAWLIMIPGCIASYRLFRDYHVSTANNKLARRIAVQQPATQSA